MAEVASATQKANQTAGRAEQLAQQDQSAIKSDESTIAANGASITALDQAMHYSLLASAEVTFGFNKSNLGKTDEAALDALVQQVQSTPRVVFELVGFTDPAGTAEYNLGLSRRRADSWRDTWCAMAFAARHSHYRTGEGARRFRIYVPNAGTQVSSLHQAR